MTKLQLKQMIGNSLMQRPELFVSGSTVIDDALAIAHQDIQVRADFRCMEQSTLALPYTTVDINGIAAPSDFKKARFLWFIDEDTGLKRGPYMPDTEAGANLEVQHDMKKRFGQGYRTDEGNGFYPGNMIAQRWYEKNLRIVLLASQNVSVILDYYAYLPVPAEDSGSNYFTQNLFKLLADGTAAFAFGMLGDTDREQMYIQKYEADLTQYSGSDSESKQGGTSEVYRPPLPIERVR